MKNKEFFSIVIGALLLAGASGKIGHTSSGFSHEATLEDRELAITAKVYTPEESKKILKMDLAAKGYVPVEVTVQNAGHHSYAISGASTAMRSAKPQEIAWKVSKGAIPRGVGLKILSLVFWPMTVASSVDSIFTFKKHLSVVKILSAKGFKEDDEIVLPYSVVKRILYVPRGAFYEDFSVALEDLSSKELVVIPVRACRYP